MAGKKGQPMVSDQQQFFLSELTNSLQIYYDINEQKDKKKQEYLAYAKMLSQG